MTTTTKIDELAEQAKDLTVRERAGLIHQLQRMQGGPFSPQEYSQHFGPEVPERERTAAELAAAEAHAAAFEGLQRARDAHYATVARELYPQRLRSDGYGYFESGRPVPRSTPRSATEKEAAESAVMASVIALEEASDLELETRRAYRELMGDLAAKRHASERAGQDAAPQRPRRLSRMPRIAFGRS